jgi:hypothetical protein
MPSVNEREKLLKSVKTYSVGINVLYGVLALTVFCLVSFLIVPTLVLLVALVGLLIFIARVGDRVVRAVAKDHPEFQRMATIGKYLPILAIASLFLVSYLPLGYGFLAVASGFLPVVLIIGGLIFQHVSVLRAGKILLSESGA